MREDEEHLDGKGLTPIYDELYKKPEGVAPDEARLEAGRKKLREELDYFGRELRGAFLAGDAPSAADFVLYPDIAYVKRIALKKPESKLGGHPAAAHRAVGRAHRGAAVLREDVPAALALVKFDLIATDGAARRGTLTLAHGKVETPAFMPVGTYGTVKAMSPAELVEIGAAHRARQHLPPVAAPGARGDRRARRAAPLHGLGRGPSSPIPAASRSTASGRCAR